MPPNDKPDSKPSDAPALRGEFSDLILASEDDAPAPGTVPAREPTDDDDVPPAPSPEVVERSNTLRRAQDRADKLHKRGAGWVDQVLALAEPVLDGLHPNERETLRELARKRVGPHGTSAEDLVAFARIGHQIVALYESAGVWVEHHGPQGHHLQVPRRQSH